MRTREPLENLVEKALGRQIRLVWTDNRSVYLSVRGSAGAETVVRLHRSFRTAPEAVRTSVARYLSTGEKGSLSPARAYFEEWLRASPRSAAGPAPRRRILRPAGACHDLDEILEQVGRSEPFRGLPRVNVSWGARRRAGSVSIRLGTYYAPRPPFAVGLIRVHPALDMPEVPRVVVGHVVHHELAHHLLACTLGGREGRRHGNEFRRLEALYEGHREAVLWIRRQLPTLLTRVRRRRVR